MLFSMNLQQMHSDQPYFSPFDTPQLDFSDISHLDLLQVVSGSLKQPYLVPCQNECDIAKGIIYGAHGRAIVSLPVSPLRKQADPLAIHFIIDTSAPTTYLSKAAIKAINRVTEVESTSSRSVNIWGTKLAVSRSLPHCKGVNILGVDYLRKANVVLECNYDEDPSKEYCILKKKK